MNPELGQIELTHISGSSTPMESFNGKTLLIVNVASKCGFTTQYKGLESLYQEYKDRGFEILGFPCNQFGGQEPGTESEISEFCELNFGVSFPLFAKVDVNGDNAHPLYRYLKKAAPGLFGTEGIKWNFTKFLIDKNGQVVKRFAPQDTPEKIATEVKALLDSYQAP
jgi:glutathione peroxidase